MGPFMKGHLEILLIHNCLGNTGRLGVHLQLFNLRALRLCGWFLTSDEQVLVENSKTGVRLSSMHLFTFHARIVR